MIGLSLICLLIDFSIIFFIDSFEKIEQKSIENEKALLKSALDYEQIQMFKNTNKSLAGISKFSICSNDTVNTIFYIKQKEALKSDIEFRAKVDETYPILINDYDLARLLGNVIDNAINASKQLKYDKKIELFMSISSDGLDITVKNRFDKKAEKPKKSNINHGNGILIVKEISSLYKVTYNATKNDDIWITKISIPNVKKQ